MLINFIKYVCTIIKILSDDFITLIRLRKLFKIQKNKKKRHKRLIKKYRNNKEK